MVGIREDIAGEQLLQEDEASDRLQVAGSRAMRGALLGQGESRHDGCAWFMREICGAKVWFAEDHSQAVWAYKPGGRQWSKVNYHSYWVTFSWPSPISPSVQLLSALVLPHSSSGVTAWSWDHRLSRLADHALPERYDRLVKLSPAQDGQSLRQ